MLPDHLGGGVESHQLLAAQMQVDEIAHAFTVKRDRQGEEHIMLVVLVFATAEPTLPVPTMTTLLLFEVTIRPR
ncbi:hypothetical protein [Bifidobacterium leontopitheci]|uniref:Uncharacterized protein n=1 Tax=Bifidobacterium leontopitheci TaxID=2650774 RepID=A0A6I1GPS7_9BIFI|nr:hypothetical protein [Bifidobacterium leontopitheci]KAB7791287.1 hypothetical protein F7D09_0240 [Bifidobacterium leontopitheci]